MSTSLCMPEKKWPYCFVAVAVHSVPCMCFLNVEIYILVGLSLKYPIENSSWSGLNLAKESLKTKNIYIG